MKDEFKHTVNVALNELEHNIDLMDEHYSRILFSLRLGNEKFNNEKENYLNYINGYKQAIYDFKLYIGYNK